MAWLNLKEWIGNHTKYEEFLGDGENEQIWRNGICNIHIITEAKLK